MYSIEVKIKFRIGHRLIEPYVGKCNNVHGEGITAIFIFQKETLDDCGMVVDFGVIKNRLKEWIDSNLDHAYVCNAKDEHCTYFTNTPRPQRVYALFGNPTAENIARLLFDIAESIDSSIKKVGIVESFDDNIAWYERSI
jgi:6-pyruvoyltetrahydropterin/6-carboxytetrahydropterin synthase